MEKSKRRWVDFEITRIRLEPEQAVLSCCDNLNKDIAGGAFDQCGAGCPAGGGANSSSS